MTSDIIKIDPDQYTWIKYLKQRINQNKNFLGIVTGQTGSGKSWSALSIGELADSEFNAERIVFTGKDLMNLINSGKLKKGSVIIWDEAGIDLSNRNWMSMANKLLNFLLQTFRHKCFILLFTTPYIDFVDNQTRKLFHGEFKTQRIDFKNKSCIVQPKLYQYNAQMKKWYIKYLRLRTLDGIAPIMSWSIPKPSDKLIEEYEKKKTQFTSRLNLKIESELKKLDKDDDLNESRNVVLTDKEDEHIKLRVEEGLSQMKVAEKMGITQKSVSDRELRLQKKGINIRLMIKKAKSLEKSNIQSISANL